MARPSVDNYQSTSSTTNPALRRSFLKTYDPRHIYSTGSDPPDLAIPMALPIAAIAGSESMSFDTPQQKFDYLSQTWRRRNRGKSVVNYYDFSYQQIIGMGKSALPFLFEETKRGSNFWYMALKAITGNIADAPDMRGNPKAIRDAWIDWGITHGIIQAGGDR